jgi:hypothetical protein
MKIASGAVPAVLGYAPHRRLVSEAIVVLE